MTLHLYKGNINVASRKSPKSLYDEAIASMEGGGSYNQTDAEGFLRIQGLPIRVQGRTNPFLAQHVPRVCSFASFFKKAVPHAGLECPPAWGFIKIVKRQVFRALF